MAKKKPSYQEVTGLSADPTLVAQCQVFLQQPLGRDLLATTILAGHRALLKSPTTWEGDEDERQL